MIKSFISDESGATAIEYGLIASLIAVAIIGALTALGTSWTACSRASRTVSAAALP
ncbi:MAG: Flp family type IVb pilin [Deltaproteobacteria bacterium]|nr:Flp family type IVb pilin [Deltaproteobacteria bacterium]